MTAMLRHSAYSILAGYEDTNDAERLTVDPAMRPVVGGRAEEKNAAFTSQMSRFETEVLPAPWNLEALMVLPGMWYEFLEDEGYEYAIRLRSNSVLQLKIAHLLTRPVGRPPRKPIVWYDTFMYRAESSTTPRRVVAKVEWHRGELFPRVGFIVTNLRRSDKAVVNFYNGRGVAEQWIEDGKNAVNWTRLYCHDFDDDQVRLQLFARSARTVEAARQPSSTRKIVTPSR
jgi:hypothetical protein